MAGRKRPSFVKRISFQIRLTEETNDERGESNNESSGRPGPRRDMLDCKTRPKYVTEASASVACGPCGLAPHRLLLTATRTHRPRFSSSLPDNRESKSATALSCAVSFFSFDASFSSFDAAVLASCLASSAAANA
jgi:hypothetical protein